ncbi:putative baseplate assembly protein [Streptomyces sp. SP17BM10]|uniref:putative baseplate assembly protein n=1 Tax=Streptomyces sp. SP17BM10 TaxID=3002530 RepID=UPI002E76C154|nr:putative baseplate assembly protein [Streptomyces sp. SP17BM10]MEE1782979.1 putative baseplate assembly protein [Streptomyces sp. SP17BM10]
MSCSDRRRRAELRACDLNGIDSVDVLDGALVVVLFGKAPEGLAPANFRIDGGERITGVTVTAVCREADAERESADRLILTVDRQGDLSAYRLSIVRADPHGRPGTEPYPGFDPRHASAAFTFRPECATLDCAPTDACPPVHPPAPEIDYLAKDYASFRRLMLDRLALTMPTWTERHVPDLGTTLVELLAYEADRLGYRQDAAATEAYLDTARHRVSVRRHARLVDYAMHDGCAARAWVCLATDDELTLPAGDFRFLTLAPTVLPELGAALLASDLQHRRHLPPYEVFEPVHAEALPLRPAHNLIHVWTWGDAECCLPAGTTSAALVDGDAHGRALCLRPGDVLVFEEVLGARTGAPADADRTHRQAVRLVSVTEDHDPLYDQPLLHVTWATGDALTFPLCVSARGGPDCADLEVGVARGNTVLVEHGACITWCHQRAEPIDVPVAPPQEPGCFSCCSSCASGTAPGRPAHPPLPVRFSPALRQVPVAQSAPFPTAAVIAAAQAARLLGLPDRARQRLTAVWHRLPPNGGTLTTAERAYLGVLFGEAVLRRLGADDHPRDALRTLLARFDDLLTPKLARWRELVRRARAGQVLRHDAEGWELGQSWGEDEAGRLREDDPAFRGPAALATAPDPHTALPAVHLTDQDGQDWHPRRDLLDSGPADRHFVGETDDDGVLRLRFGDGLNGAAFPLSDAPGVQCTARYRVGNGTPGNVGPEAIARIVLCATHRHGIRVVRNPLPASGGLDPEPVDDVRRLAPVVPTTRLLRAITADDYAALAATVPGVRRAAADLRWTGSWYEAQVAVEAFGTETAPDALLDTVRAALFRFRRIGHDLAEFTAALVPLDVALRVRVESDHVAGHVRAGLLAAFAALFAPDALVFGDPVRVSRLVTAAVSVPGVQHAEVTRLRRLFAGPADRGDALATGVLPIGPLEVAQLDNDPSRPEHGHLALDVEGGR